MKRCCPYSKNEYDVEEFTDDFLEMRKIDFDENPSWQLDQLRQRLERICNDIVEILSERTEKYGEHY